MIPFANPRSTLTFVGIIIGACSVFALFADAFTGAPEAEPGFVATPEVQQDIPVIVYNDHSGEEMAGWYDEEAAFDDEGEAPIIFDDGGSSDYESSYDDYFDAGSQVSYEADQGSEVSGAPRVE